MVGRNEPRQPMTPFLPTIIPGVPHGPAVGLFVAQTGVLLSAIHFFG